MSVATELLPAFPVTIEPAWIDFNGHVRDAYYALAASYATDAAMEHFGLGAKYRERTRCTLYTVELHIHCLREIKLQDELSIVMSVFDFDRQRIHVGCRFVCARLADAAATAELLLVHVHQGVIPFVKSLPDEVATKLLMLKSIAPPRLLFMPESRKIALPTA